MDGLRLLRGILSPPLAAAGLDARAHSQSLARVAVGGEASTAAASATTSQPLPLPRQSHMFPRPFRKLWPGGDGEHGVVEEEEEELAMDLPPARVKGNWVVNILRVRSLWAEERGEKGDAAASEERETSEVGGDGEAEEEEGCLVDVEEEEEVVVDRESFSSLLRRVSLVDVELYAKMSYLSNLAYCIAKIKPANLLKYHALRLVTSSLEKKAQSLSATKELNPVKDHEQEKKTDDCEENEAQGENGNILDASVAYEIAATAASYLQSRTKSILPFHSANSDMGKDSPEGGSSLEEKCENAASDMASFVATTNSVTAVVAGKEEMKQAVAKDLNSLHSSPCEWFICDDDSNTRYVIIQGSETLASWQANLLFEPIQFEGLDVLVHRGIYEAAKGIYQQILPEIQAHLKSCGKSATLRFTGHSLGGSLSLLVNLMLLIRGDAPPSSLLPVITFGAPTIMCGGDYLLQKLGLPQTHVQAITMHRDIVPRAFSCNYPDHVAKILATVNGNFRNHPCLENQKLLYAPMGKLLILQPEEKFSPHHHLLPSGSGLYLFGHLMEDSKSVKLLQEAQRAFLNSPHPLEILSDRAAYGSDGTVYRDHDMRAYLRSVRAIIRQELKQIRKAKRENRRLLWWPLVLAQGGHSDVITGRRSELMNSTPHSFSFTGAFYGGKERLKRFGRMVVSQHIHLVILLLFPARLFLLGTVSLVKIS